LQQQTNHKEGIKHVHDEPRQEDNSHDGHILLTVQAQHRLHQPPPETGTAKHLAAAWFDNQVKERLMADAAHELIIDWFCFHIGKCC
jgi:hypothetical protein